MTHYVQLHFLTVYPPSNPNRDDMGRPKTAVYGGVQRLRLSSQSLKRAARLSPAMSESLIGNMGQRTQRLGDEVVSHLLGKGADEKKAYEAAEQVAKVFGAFDEAAAKKDPSQVRIRQLAFISPEERAAAIQMAEKAFSGESIQNDAKKLGKDILRTADGAVDLAMFGRMLADAPEFNREAAVQVSHAITTHRAEAEDDFYTAVDDLKKPAEDSGAGFVGEAGFGSGVYYLYVCIDTDRLIENLAGDRELARKALEAATEAFATASPSGKRNSYSHHTRASYIRAESGDQQPRSLAAAFLNPVNGDDLLGASINKLKETAEKIDNAYGPAVDKSVEMDVPGGNGALAEIKAFVAEQIGDA